MAIAFAKLQKAKANYEKARETSIKKWEENIDKRIKAPKHALNANQAIEFNQKRKGIMSMGDRYDGVSDIEANSKNADNQSFRREIEEAFGP